MIPFLENRKVWFAKIPFHVFYIDEIHIQAFGELFMQVLQNMIELKVMEISKKQQRKTTRTNT